MGTHRSPTCTATVPQPARTAPQKGDKQDNSRHGYTSALRDIPLSQMEKRHKATKEQRNAPKAIQESVAKPGPGRMILCQEPLHKHPLQPGQFLHKYSHLGAFLKLPNFSSLETPQL